MCARKVLQVLAPVTSQHDIMLAVCGSALGKHHSAAYELQYPLCPAERINYIMNKTFPVMAKQ